MAKGLEIRLRNSVYHAAGTIAGRRIRKSLGTRNKQQALELCALYEAKLWKRSSYGEESVRTFEEAALSYQIAGKERRFLAPIIRHFRGRNLGSIKPGEIKEAARLLYPKAKGATLNRHVIVPARAVIGHAAALGWCGPIRVEAFPTGRPHRRAVDRAWIDAFLAQADKDKLPHLASAQLFMWQNGVRVSEVARVMPEHVNVHRRTILLARTKTGAWETRHLSRELAVRIANLQKTEGQPLFGYRNRWGIRQRAIAVCRRAEIEFVPSHQSGRHSFATNALAMGADPRQVMEAGGWKSARMVLEIYAHAADAGRAVAALFDGQGLAEDVEEIKK